MKSPGHFPGGPVAKTPCSPCRGPGFHPWSGNEIPHATTKRQLRVHRPRLKDSAWCNNNLAGDIYDAAEPNK